MSLDTLAERASHALEVRHSRFLANAAPVASAAEAAAFVQEVSVPDATHNCWAWRLGQDYRSSDDGRLDEARASLQEFVRRHPQATVPDDLRPLLDR